jgi:NitT/TauT family transport system substrate-binding protein
LIDKGRVPKPVQDSFRMPFFPPAGAPTAQEVGDVVQWMKGKGLLAQDLSYAQLVTASYLPNPAPGVQTPSAR